MAVVETPTGCVAFPDDRQQMLCGQHLLTVWDGTDGDFVILMATECAWRVMGGP